MVGDYIDDDKITWNIARKTSRGNVEVEDAQNIGHFCLRSYVVPLSSSKARVTIMAYPLSLGELQAQHHHCKEPAFPGLELWQCEVNMFPLAGSSTGKAWGCPLVPLLHLSGDQDEFTDIPSTEDIKAAISSTLRTAMSPTAKRDLKTLTAAWTAVQESGPSKLREKVPDTIWPLWERNSGNKNGM